MRKIKNIISYIILAGRRFNAPGAQAGFTIIELLVGVFIIALLSGIFLANYRSGSKGTELKNATQKMASDIRLAQNLCLGSADFKGAITSGGWGVYIEKAQNRYHIFADQNSSGGRSAIENYLTVALPSNIEISNISSGNFATVIFFPPDPETKINGSESQVSVTLKDKSTQKTYTVIVNKMGLIEVQ